MCKISKANVYFKLYTRNQSVVKAIFYITTACSSAVLSYTNIDLKCIYTNFLKKKREKKRLKTKQKHTHTQLLKVPQSQLLN